MRRVLVIGSPGAGKSIFAQALSQRTGLPLTPLDREYWRPGWVRPDAADWGARVRGLISADAWILDGNYTSTVLLRAGRADTVIVLEYPRMLCLYRAICRALLNRRPDEVGVGREPLNLPFLRFIWTFPAVQQRQLAELSSLPHLNLVRLMSDAHARRWLSGLSSP